MYSSIRVALSALVVLACVGCGGGGGSSSPDGGTPPPPPPPAVTITAVPASVVYGHYASPGVFTSWASRTPSGGQVNFTAAECPYLRVSLDADGVSLIDEPRATIAIYLDPVGGSASLTPVTPPRTYRFWQTGVTTGPMDVPLGGYATDYLTDPYSGRPVTVGQFTIRVVATPVSGFPAGTPATTILINAVTIMVAPGAPG